MIPIPWMVAMALQAAGWYLRQDIKWWLAYLFSATPRFWFYQCRDAVRGAYVRWKCRA